MNAYLGILLAVGLFLSPPVALAQLAADDDPADAGLRPVTQAAFLETGPVVDGLVVDDPVWSAVPVLTRFWQTEPDEGQVSSEQTEVRLLYTPTTLFVGVVCYDRDPARIISADSRRDAQLDETDSFSFILDTYRDGQNGFVFGTNPAGVEYDAQVSNEGQGALGNARQTMGSGGGLNVNWDGSWEVRTHTGSYGWSAEFAIPFRTLRFPREGVQDWGINFKRTIRRRNEAAYWARLPRQYNLYRVSRAGTLEGLQVPDLRNLKIMPYVLGEAKRDFTVPAPTTDMEGDIGVDLKYSITPSLTLDATYNTDFAQVEVDELQVNLDRFNLFFPEKRPFFLENAGLFTVGDPGAVEFFFSRRIGIGPDGMPIPILGGGRVSGNIAGTNVGVLNMQTQSVGDSIQANNFAVVRLRQDLANRSAIGGLVTNRQGTGDLAPADDHNRLVALDGRLGIGRYGLVSGYVSRSFTPDLAEGQQRRQYAYNLGAQYDSEQWLVEFSYTEIAEAFNPEVGFLQRSSYRNPGGVILYRFRPDDFLGFLELRPHVSYRGYWGFDDFQETGFLHIDTHWEWRGGYEIHTGYNLTREGVREAFEIAEDVVVPAGTYDHREALLVGFTDQSRWISLNTRATIGGFFGGDRVSLTSTLRLRAGEALSTEFILQRNDVDLPNGSFVANLYRARVSYSFTPRIFVQSLVQYNEQANLWSANLRFGWLQAANTGLFVVYNQTNDTDGLSRGVMDRSFIIKYTHLFDVLR